MKNKEKKDKTTKWEFDLYIAGQTPRSITALTNLKIICEKLQPDNYQIDVIDLLKHPHLAKEMQIFAIPTVIRRRPEPQKRSIGDFSDQDDQKIKLWLEADIV